MFCLIALWSVMIYVGYYGGIMVMMGVFVGRAWASWYWEFLGIFAVVIGMIYNINLIAIIVHIYSGYLALSELYYNECCSN